MVESASIGFCSHMEATIFNNCLADITVTCYPGCFTSCDSPCCLLSSWPPKVVIQSGLLLISTELCLI